MSLEEELRELIKAKHRQDGTYKGRLKRIEDRETEKWKADIRQARERRAG